MNDRIYMDYNATTPLRPAAREAVIKAHDSILNASAQHSYGREGRKIIEDARSIVANAVNCPPAQLIFNSGATEGNNTVLKYFEKTYPDQRILVGATEHSCVKESAQNITTIPVDKNGVTDLDALEALLKEKPQTSLVSVMLANNESGVIQPIKEISALVHKHGALLHSDAIQALGRIPIDIQTMGIDFLTLSSHKNGGPQGSGALAIGLCGITPVLLHGGGQEKKARAGTENTAGIAGFGAATQESLGKMEAEHTRLSHLQKHLESGIKDIAENVIIHGEDVPRLPNTSFFSIPGTSSETMLMAFDLEGIAISNGSACSSGTIKPSYVLQAMGAPDNMARAALRISTGWNTKESDIDRVLEICSKIYKRLSKTEKKHA